jgi:uncharacterized spore protein YtfJ
VSTDTAPTKEFAMDDSERAIQTAEESVKGGADQVAAMLAERVGSRAGVQAIFGDPVEREGVTVIPVGRVRWGFGGGGGSGGARTDMEGEGSGGGGGAIAAPVGYIQISGGTARYTPIGFPVPPATVIAGALATYLVLRGLRALLR